jgi:pimeloyl-ACP methyl ester carboxylesterase
MRSVAQSASNGTARQALPAATTIALADAGHWPHEERPDEVVRAVREFVDQSATIGA